MTGTTAYALNQAKITTVATGVQDVYFDSTGDMVVELRDGSTVSRALKDIKSMAEVNGDLIVTYSDNTTANVGKLPSGEDGFSPVATVSKSGNTATITVTDATGTTTTTVSDGQDGESVTVQDVIYTGTTPPPAGSSYTMWVDTNTNPEYADQDDLNNLFNS